MGELQGQSQRYNAQLQEYNGRLQNEVRGLKDAVAALQAAKDTATEATAALRGQLTAAEAQITTAKVRSAPHHKQYSRARGQDRLQGRPVQHNAVSPRPWTKSYIRCTELHGHNVTARCSVASWQSSQSGCVS